MIIREIQPKPVEAKKLRVAAYARVSADKDAAFHSLKAQEDYYEQYVPAHENWELVDIYSDNGISGTIVERPEFQRMLQDARAGKIDLIVTKSITRFARNVVCLLETMRELKHLGIDIYFEKEQMHSISPDGELLLTLMAIYAEEEARSVSENIRWKVRHCFEAGEPWKGRMCGYRKQNGKLVVVPEEAEIVRRIFRECLAGKSSYLIAKGLNQDGLRTIRGNIWTTKSIDYILTNEKYAGNMLQQKTYRPDFRTKKQFKNHGEVRQYYVEGSHEAIISAADFAQAQRTVVVHPLSAEEKARRAKLRETCLFSGLLVCGECGAHYSRYLAAKGSVRWLCRTHMMAGNEFCSARPVREADLIAKTREVLGLAEGEELTRELLASRVQQIVLPYHDRLLYILKDGTRTEVDWHYASQSEVWTPEMRRAAGDRIRERYRKQREQKAQAQANSQPNPDDAIQRGEQKHA